MVEDARPEHVAALAELLPPQARVVWIGRALNAPGRIVLPTRALARSDTDDLGPPAVRALACLDRAGGGIPEELVSASTWSRRAHDAAVRAAEAERLAEGRPDTLAIVARRRLILPSTARSPEQALAAAWAVSPSAGDRTETQLYAGVLALHLGDRAAAEAAYATPCPHYFAARVARAFLGRALRRAGPAQP